MTMHRVGRTWGVSGSDEVHVLAGDDLASKPFVVPVCLVELVPAKDAFCGDLDSMLVYK